MSQQVFDSAEAEKEKNRRKAKLWRERYPQESRRRAAAWAAANPDRVKENKRRYRENNREAVNARQKRWQEANKEQIRIRVKAYNAQNRRTIKSQRLQKMYGITLETFEHMLASQGGVCAICRGLSGRRGAGFCVDHNHDTGKVRGILCKSCNVGLGCFRDRADLMQAGVVYINTHGSAVSYQTSSPSSSMPRTKSST